MFPRRLKLPPPGARTFFLWGPRQVGKTTLLRQHYPDAMWIDLLKADEFRRYATRPESLRLSLQTEGADPTRQVVVDEILKVPALLDEVHWMIENLDVRFALCASSARKVRRGAASLLGGRALRYELRGLTSAELGAAFDLHRIVNCGFLPRPYLDPEPDELIESYIADYLKEEIAAEGLVRNLPVFADFLEAAALADTEMVPLLKRGAGLRRQQPDGKGLLRDPGGHPAWSLASPPGASGRSAGWLEPPSSISPTWVS